MVKDGGLDVSVLMAWQQLSGLTVMTHAPFMEHHDKAPRPSQHMQFGNYVVAPAENTDNTISFDALLTHPFSLTSICKISAMTSLLQWSMTEEWLCINLCKTVQSSKVSP
jgi:hypothetical protein